MPLYIEVGSCTQYWGGGGGGGGAALLVLHISSWSNSHPTLKSFPGNLDLFVLNENQANITSYKCFDY